jgi:hypothetical protein
MQRMRSRLAAAALTAIACLVTAPAPYAEDGGPPWTTWRMLRLQARGSAVLSGEFVMRRHPGGGSCRIESEATARFLGAPVARSRTVSLTHEPTGRTSRHVSLSKKRGRRYVVGPTSYTVERLRPPPRGSTSDEAWEVVSRKSFALPASNTPVYDYYAMLLRLAGESLAAPGDETRLTVATADGPRAYRVRVAESRTGRRTLLDRRAGRKVTHTIRELRLAVIPPSGEEEGFLDMQGETQIWVEATTKTPVEISGRVPRMGRVRLELVELG